MDAMTGGYIIPLWADIQITNPIEDNNDKLEPEITWKTTREVFERSVDGANMIKVPEDKSIYVFKFVNL